METVPSVQAVTLPGVSAPVLAAGKVRESGKAVSRVGKITPVNLLSGSGRFISNKVLSDCDVCCGPYAECHICNY